MTTEDKDLLLKDISARLPYDCKVTIAEGGINGLQWNNVTLNSYLLCQIEEEDSWEYIKPYLRPMSSMTEEEILELYKIAYDTWYSDSLYYKNEEWINFKDSIKNNNLYFGSSIWLSNINKVIDWLNKNMFDYRGLIEKGLALEAPEGMYKEE